MLGMELLSNARLCDDLGAYEMQIIVDYSPAIATVVLVLGLVGYVGALALAAFFSRTETGGQARVWFDCSPACNLGIPCSAVAAFAIVASLLRVFPGQTEGGALVIEVFSLIFQDRLVQSLSGLFAFSVSSLPSGY